MSRAMASTNAIGLGILFGPARGFSFRAFARQLMGLPLEHFPQKLTDFCDQKMLQTIESRALSYRSDDSTRTIRALAPARRGAGVAMLMSKVESRLFAGSTSRQETIAGPAVDELAQRFRQSVLPELDAAYSFARFLCKDGDAAHDIVQDAFVKAFRAYGGFKGGDVRAWVFAIVRNCYRDWMMAKRRVTRFEVTSIHEDDESPLDAIASEADTPETSLLRKTEAEAVRTVLMALPRPLREILVLREIEDLSYRDIAEITTLPIGTVMSRLARARREFAKSWSSAPAEARA
jgi:RNA polymerase sigma-70 factor (ECF subfamily)